MILAKITSLLLVPSIAAAFTITGRGRTRRTAKVVTPKAQQDGNMFNGTNLKRILDNVDPVGTFATAGTFKPELLSPHVEIEGVGPVGLPMHPAVAAVIRDTAAEEAPFSRGLGTLIDESVRKAWQVDPSKVRVSGTNWNETEADVEGGMLRPWYFPRECRTSRH